MNYLSKLIDWHKAQIGTKETGKNINKYADDMAKNYPDFLNGNKQGYDWCAVYQMDGFCNVYGMDNALKMLNLGKKNLSASCTQLVRNFKSNQSFFTSPQKGDLIFFDWDKSGDADHVGFVMSIDGNIITTIEGNSSDMVKKNTYFLGDTRIVGYGRPSYDLEDSNKVIDTVISRVEYMRVLKKGCKGDDVRQLQVDLNKTIDAGLEIDGSFGSLTEKAVKDFQTKFGIQVDGSFGSESRTTMEKALNNQISIYSQIDFVKDIQSVIGARIDGHPGSETISKTITVSQKTNRNHPAVKYIQRYLNSIGYYCGNVDGDYGIKTASAIKKFQIDKVYGNDTKNTDGVITAHNKTWQKLLGMI